MIAANQDKAKALEVCCPREVVALTADRVNHPHPYLLVDVEHGLREDDIVFDLREDLHQQCVAGWTADTQIAGSTPLPLLGDTGGSTPLRALLKESQRTDSDSLELIRQLEHSTDPEVKRRRKTGASKKPGPLKPVHGVVEGTWRLAPSDGVLERFVVFSVAAMWLPYAPDAPFPVETARAQAPVAVNSVSADAMKSAPSWRRWIFLAGHETFLNPHRTASETFQVVRRMAVWATLAADVSNWCLACHVCRKFRGHTLQAPMRSILADDALAAVLPWLDVLIDVQGPFTKAETGEQYTLSYHSLQLRVPLVEPFQSLQAGYFSRALVACLMRSRQIPDVVRSDRGPEMRSAVNREFHAILSIKQTMGAALTPRHQGPGERAHQVVMEQHMMLMHAICLAFPQEWPSLMPAVEYLYWTTPQGSHGLSAHDMLCGSSIATPNDNRLAPFLVPSGLPQTDVAARLFSNFRELYTLFMRVKTEETLRSQLRVNLGRHERTFFPGETVFRRLPMGARLPKHLLPEPSSGPYEVVSQPTSSSLILKKPGSDELLDGGAHIPLDQLLAGPPRPVIAFSETDEVRGIGRMIQEQEANAGRAPGRAGQAAGKQRGWGPLAPGAYVAYQTKNAGPDARDVSVGKVLVNNREDRRITLQPYRGCWHMVRVVHLPQFQTRDGYADEGEEPAKETVRYDALVLQVELLVGGELRYGSARSLQRRGWGLLIDKRPSDVDSYLGEVCSALGAAPAAKNAGPSPASGAPLTGLGGKLELLAKLVQGRLVSVDRRALEALAYGHRVAFLEVFCGAMHLTLGVRAQGLCAIDGIDKLFPLGDRHWDLHLREDQRRVELLAAEVDPLVLHTAPPCTKLSTAAPRKGEPGYSEYEYHRAVSLVAFSVRLIAARVRALASGSLESPHRAATWRIEVVITFFGKIGAPKKGRYFAETDLCQFDLKEPGTDDTFWRKGIVIAATYPEVLELGSKCPLKPGAASLGHKHQQLRGYANVPGLGSVPRTTLSATYPMELALAWGSAIARACFRICAYTAQEWAEKQLAEVRADPDKAKAVEVQAKALRMEKSFAIWEPSGMAYSLGGVGERVFATDPDGFAPPLGVPAKGSAEGAAPAASDAADSQAPEYSPTWADAAQAQQSGKATWGALSPEQLTPAQRAWLTRLDNGDFDGPRLSPEQYLDLRDEKVQGNPRMAHKYREKCCEAVGLGAVPDERYPHITNPADFDLMRWAVRRGSGCMWLPDSPRTCVRGFRHRLITRGPPVRQGLHRLSKPDTEWVEQAIREDVARGQLIKGVSDWGFPAFPTKEGADHKAIKRKRRMVVDYRALNRVTVRKVFLIPNSDYIKTCVSGSTYISVGDLKEGFNQVDNTPETAAKMAVLVASGCYLPRGLTFGPTNGPEDFQDLVFNVFARRLYREWYLFLDDLSIATGRKDARGPGPSGAADVWG